MKKQGFVVLALTLLSPALLVAPDQSTGTLAALEAPASDRKATSRLLPDAAAIQVTAAPAANIIQAASCAQEHVQTAIDAAIDGDFVLVPAGACTWTTLSANTPAVSMAAKAITLQGAGIGETVITDGTGTAWNTYLIRVDGAEGKPFRITGFTFTEVNLPAAIYITGACKDFRIDHCRIENPTAFSTAINPSGYTYGVIDHCAFLNLRVLVRNDGGDAWQRPLTLGTANAVYVEDCSFDATVHCNTVDASNGARYVFRHNSVNNSYVEAHTCNNAGMRGTFSYEIYENTFSGSQFTPFLLRAGTGVVFSNTISGNFQNSHIRIDNRRSCENPCPEEWGMCDGTSAVDGNTPGMLGYPCLDQIGRSTDSGFATAQALEPLYEWNNWDAYRGTDVDIILNPAMCATMTHHIQEGRDYHNDTPRPGYTPYEYPHPLTQDLVLSGAPADEAIHLNWSVAAWTYLPPTTTWQITYTSQTGTLYPAITGIISPTRAYTLTGLANYQWYTVTLRAMVGATSILSGSVRVMPTGILVYLPLVLRAY
jgi:hypothetical protein